MILLHLKKQIYTGGGYMLSDNSIVYFIIYNPIMWIAIIWVLLFAYSEWYHRKNYGKYNDKNK